jgi:uncharacterized membrane protein YraQ (UPF0718 family)
MNLGTAIVSLLLIVIVGAIIRGIIKDRRAGKNVGCASCKSCVHSISSQKTSHTHAETSCPSCSSLDKMLADMEKSVESSPDTPPSQSLH